MKNSTWAAALLLAAAGMSLLSVSSPATADTIQRTVEFRDGTILRLDIPDAPLPWHKASRDGTVTREPMPWSQVDQLYLVTTPALEKLAEIKGLLNRLGSNKYIHRVEAHKNLIEKGVHFRGVVEEVFNTTKDPEVRWRLEAVLKAMDTDIDPAQYNYDLVSKTGTGEEVEGDVGDLSLPAKFRGTTVILDRQRVCRINRLTMPGGETITDELGRAQVITEDDDDLFPKNVTRINFDRGPAGELLVPGRDLKEMFVPLGCTLHTSYEDSFVSVEDYNVRGRSGNLCIATHDPLYQGELTVRFCLPGNAGVPAGVHYVGFWTAYVEPGGTSLEAYDVHDRLIGVATTGARGRDFLAVKSRTPIAYIKVVCDEEIDKDFAIDDLFYDPPVTLSEASDPKWLTVLLSSGERIKCRDFAKSGDKLALSQLSIGVESVEVPLGEVFSIMPATESAKRPETAFDCLVMLDDSSILRARGGEKFTDTNDREIPTEKLVAIWGAGSSLTLPDDEAWPKSGALMVGRDKHHKVIEDWQLGERWIEGEGLDLFDFTYADTPIIWLQRPGERAKDAGIVRLAGGEQYVLTGDGRYQLADWSAEKVKLARDGGNIEIPFEQVLTLRFPRDR